MLAGPYAGMLLADLGAEVIKIETGTGDIARSTDHHELDGHNLYFASLNRNKKSVLLDLTNDQDREQFHALAKESNALITNLRPRAIRKLGLTYEHLRTVNPKIVCVALTGFGLNGAFSEYPAYDYVIQAMTGITMLTGEPDGPPVRAGYSVVDNTGGMLAALGLVAELLRGEGGQVEVALFDAMLSQLNYLASKYLNLGVEPKRYPAGGHSFFVPAQMFDTANGHVALFITHDEFWRIFAAELGVPRWLADERFSSMKGRSINRELVVAEITAVLRTRTSEEWVARLQPLGVVIAAVTTMAKALDSDAVRERGMIAHIPTTEGPLQVVANPIKIAGVTERMPRRLGSASIRRTARSKALRSMIRHESRRSVLAARSKPGIVLAGESHR